MEALAEHLLDADGEDRDTEDGRHSQHDPLGPGLAPDTSQTVLRSLATLGSLAKRPCHDGCSRMALTPTLMYSCMTVT